jgi:hypothetical protein
MLTAVLIKIQVFWDVTPSRLVTSYRRFGAAQCPAALEGRLFRLLNPAEKGIIFPRNVTIYKSTRRNNPEDPYFHL